MIYPTYTFEVIAYDLSDVMSFSSPDSLENILFGLGNKTVWIETIDRSMKHGDQFTVSGLQALYIKKNYVDVDEPLLRITCMEGECLPTVTTDDLLMGPASSEELGSIPPNGAGVLGTITSIGGSEITEYGFVWAEHDNPILEDNVEIIGNDNFIGQFSVEVNGLPYPATVYFAAYATNSYGTSYGDVLNGEVQICLAAGTKITLANGDKKNIEDITYDDDLLIWNFDERKFGSSKPVWIVKPFKARRCGVVKFDNGTELRTIVDGKGHRIFNMNKGMFTFSMNEEETPLETETITAQQETIKVIGKEVVKEDTVFYNIITHTHFNMFANDILTSTGMNNLYPITDMKFVKDHDRESFTNDDFENISPDIISGLRLLEQPVDYPNLKEKINRILSRMIEK